MPQLGLGKESSLKSLPGASLASIASIASRGAKGIPIKLRNRDQVPQLGALLPTFLVGRAPLLIKIGYRNKGSLILTSLLEDLGEDI